MSPYFSAFLWVWPFVFSWIIFIIQEGNKGRMWKVSLMKGMEYVRIGSVNLPSKTSLQRIRICSRSIEILISYISVSAMVKKFSSKCKKPMIFTNRPIIHEVLSIVFLSPNYGRNRMAEEKLVKIVSLITYPPTGAFWAFAAGFGLLSIDSPIHW